MSSNQKQGANNQYTAKGQNVPQHSTSEKLAAEYGVNEKTIKRNAKFSQGVDLLPDDKKNEVLSDKSDLTNSEVQSIAPVKKQAETYVKEHSTTIDKDRLEYEIEERAKQLAVEKLREIEQSKQRKKEEKKAIRANEIETTKKKIEQENTIITDKFDVIVIDPPWAYEERGGIKNDAYDPDQSRSAVPYPTMKIDELKDLKLPEKKDCVLFLWTTHAFLRDAFNLLDAWGYSYKATMVWDKEIIGMGRNLRMQCEFCLLATKGNPTLLNREKERDIIREKRREHSRKPEEFYNKVERMTIGKRIDYFSRQKRENWFHYGAETGKF